LAIGLLHKVGDKVVRILQSLHHGPTARGRKERAARRRVAPEVAALEERALLSTMDADLMTTASVNGTAVTSPYVTNAPSVAVNFSATDPDDSAPGTLATQFSVNGGAFTPGNSLTLTNQGNYTISYFSTEPDGDFEATKTLLVTIDRTAPTIAITSVSPSTLWPPNGKFVPVTVMGTVTDNLSGVVSPLTVRVRNEPGYQGGFTLPTTPVVVQPTMTSSQTGGALAGNFDFTVTLQARRFGFDFDGRQYTILVTATDAAGNSSTASTVVTVPHDQGHNSGGGQSGPGEGEGSGGNVSGGKHGHGEGNSHSHGNGQGQGNSGSQGNSHGHGNGHGQGKGQNQGSGNSHGHGHGHGH
jgi:hypothetical protein